MYLKRLVAVCTDQALRRLHFVRCFILSVLPRNKWTVRGINILSERINTKLLSDMILYPFQRLTFTQTKFHFNEAITDEKYLHQYIIKGKSPSHEKKKLRDWKLFAKN